MDFILDGLDTSNKRLAFESNKAKLRVAPQIDFDVLSACVLLLPSQHAIDVCGGSRDSQDLQDSAASSSVLTSDEDPFAQYCEESHTYDDLFDAVLQHIHKEQNPVRLYTMAEICLSNGLSAAYQLHQKIWKGLHASLHAILKPLAGDKKKLVNGGAQLHELHDLLPKEHICQAAAYLRFMKCSFWLSPEAHHMIHPTTIRLLSCFIGIPELDDAAIDALSTLLSLLRSSDRIAVAVPSSPSLSWATFSLNRYILRKSPLFYIPLWDRISQLGPDYFTSKSSKLYRIWFQWISQAAHDGIDLACLQDDRYWNKVRMGLLDGFADQRKYCLGIISQSLLAARHDISTPTMEFCFSGTYRAAYEQYATLYETIVLHRYSGQVEAALSELTALFANPSRITQPMATTLLTAALNPKIQEGIRKMIGYWYMDFIVKDRGDISGHVDFLLEGFLPWATEGSLFISTMTATRAETVCTHGAAVTAVIARFVSELETTPPSVSSTDPLTSDNGADDRHSRAVILGVVRYILNAGGRIFQPAILYLLEGLIRGLGVRSEKTTLQQCLKPCEIVQIVGLSRLTGLPEISNDLLSLYCQQLCELIEPNVETMDIVGYKNLHSRTLKLKKPVDSTDLPASYEEIGGDLTLLQPFLNELHASNHRSIQGIAFAPACERLVSLLDQTKAASIDQSDLFTILAAFWDEAERREFGRPVAIHLPPLLFHPTCVEVCAVQQSDPNIESEGSLLDLLSKAMKRLQELSKGRSYILSVLTRSLRKAVFSNHSSIGVLPFQDFILDYLNDPPSIKPEFLFEVAAAEKLQQILPHRTYASYYGLREWHAYAAFIDILRRFPAEQMNIAKGILDRLLEPWNAQEAPIPIKGAWKNTLQLQAMLLLSDYCITEADADSYIDSLMHALVLEPWPRYRFLLEWIVARIYRRYPGKTSRILDGLEKLDDFTPIHMASLMKLGLLVAPFESEGFAIEFATHLNCFCASPKVQIRHEANFAFPQIFDLAETKGWKSITDNPSFKALNTFIRRLDKFHASPWTIRTLKLDAVGDFTLVKIFQGKYLSIESPERERVAYEDFIALQKNDVLNVTNLPPTRIPLGEKPESDLVAPVPAAESPDAPSVSVSPAFFQTKAGSDLESLHPTVGPPTTQSQRPSSVILVASLIDNPTNLGGLSRISESFGLEALYIDSLKKTAHKDFKATSVTSEKHFPIYELKIAGVPNFLLEAKRKGYEVVGIEQTDRSGILGDAKVEAEREDSGTATSEGKGSDAAMADDSGEGGKRMSMKDSGTLPKKCVLVLGSEKGGITPEVLAVIDRCVEIKTVGVTRSLNVQTAGGIAVYEWWREWGGKR